MNTEPDRPRRHSLRLGNLTRTICVLALWIFAVAPSRAGAQILTQILTRQDLEKQIQVYRSASLRAEPPLMAAVPAGRIWSQLGTLYEDAGMYEQSEIAFRHAIQLLTVPPVSRLDLARGMDDMGTLYMERGNTKEAERDEQQALQLRLESIRQSDLARSWYHLATLYLREHRPAKARDYAERAVNELLADGNSGPDEKMNALFTLAASLCGSHQYPQAIVTIQRANRLVNSIYRPDDFPAGFGAFLLGYAYWKAGATSSAGEWMKKGAAIMQKQLGWGHPAYLSMMTQYARFLRKTHQTAAAHNIEEQVRSARTVPGYRDNPENIATASLF